MSWKPNEYTCSHCGFHQDDTVIWGCYEYQLPDGRRAPVLRQRGWCGACNGIRPIEILSLEAWEKEVKSVSEIIDSLGPEPVRRIWHISKSAWRKEHARWLTSHKSWQSRLAAAKDGFAMLASRESPPRCLLCSGTDVSGPIPGDKFDPSIGNPSPYHTGFLHPGCEGELLVSTSIMRISIAPTTRLYSVEGDFMGEDTASE